MPIESWMSCRDLAASVAFYTEVLDFELVVAPHPDPDHFDSRHAVVSRDGDIVHLNRDNGDNAVFGTQIYVRVTNVDALCEKFVANGVVLSVPIGETTPVDQTWGMREIGFRDPDGNKLTFGQPITL